MVNYVNYANLIQALSFYKKDKHIKWSLIEKPLKYVHRYIRISLENSDSSVFSIDIHFFDKQSGHIRWNLKNEFLVSQIFPLKLRPFGKYWLPSPNNPGLVLNTEHKNLYTNCHRNVMCDDLSTKYGFVERTCFDHKHCLERLELNSIIIGEIEYNS